MLVPTSEYRHVNVSIQSIVASVAGRTSRARRQRERLAGYEPLESRLPLANTVGLIQAAGARAFDGYTLLGSSTAPRTHLIDNAGNKVHTWTSAYPATSSYLLEDGRLLRNCILPLPMKDFNNNGGTGRIEILDWDSNVTWFYDLSNAQYQLHHDAIVMPNGNILAIAWERLTFEQAVGMGRNPATLNPDVNNELWPEVIIEIDPDVAGGEVTTGLGEGIVWQWHMKDHVVQQYDPTKPNYLGPKGVRQHPELINLNYVPKGPAADTHLADWAHFNSIDYNASTDQIIVSVREFCEIWIVDHSTTTEEAAGHTGGNAGKGGDLLWRYGNDSAWNRRAKQTLFWQHDAQWIRPDLPGAGNILVYNNGWNRNGGKSFSSVMELRQSPTAYGRADVVWSFRGPPSFFSPIVSGAQRLPNGNTLVNAGAKGTIFEVTASRRVVWRYVNPDTFAGPVQQGTVPPALNVSGTPGVQRNITFRALRYAPTYAGLTGRTLQSQGPIERPAVASPS
jgi:hypothetical protein